MVKEPKTGKRESLSLLPSAAVLLVDDRRENLVALEAMLQPLGERLVTASSGEEALRHLLDDEFAVILLDVQMPTLDGIETAGLIRRRKRNADTPIIFVTAVDKDEELVREAYSLGAVDYVFKPIAQEILRAKVSVFVELFKARKREEVRAAELALLNEELEAFSYSVSHDLRAPVTRIMGFCKALRRQLTGALDETAAHHLDRIEHSSQRMDALIQDLLRLSRITRTGMTLETVDLTGIGHSVIAELRQAEPNRQVEVTIDNGLTCRADRALLRVVLENLLSNAWKYTRKTADAQVAFGATRQGRDTVFFVRDNGTGFDMEHATKLFAPFQRLHSARDFEGTGVGLATVLRIMRRHGGRVWGEGSVGKGATFYFSFSHRG